MNVEMSEIAVINDSNNAPFLFRSLCEIVSDCFGALVFLFGSSASKPPFANLL